MPPEGNQFIAPRNISRRPPLPRFPENLRIDESRLTSLDLFRGIVMFFLIAEVTGIYELLARADSAPILKAVAMQFRHHPWHGLRLWDLGQPFFMFISGTAMVFSYQKRWKGGESWGGTFRHAARRALVLFSLGWALSRINPIESGGANEFLLDILPQLALAGFLGFLLLRCSALSIAGVAAGIILTTELLYRLWPAPGFDQLFTPGHNFGSIVDLSLFGRLSEGDWVTFNIVPSTAFVLSGILAGRLIRSGRAPSRKLWIMAFSGASGILAGLALDPQTPIIRRICTSSFVILAVGSSLLAFALAYWIADVARIRAGSKFFVSVGMNPIFIYVFAFSGGAEWLEKAAAPFTLGLSKWIGGDKAQILLATVVWGLMWAICRLMYAKKIFIKA